MPARFDLARAPLGSWAEYNETHPGPMTIKQRIAYVATGPEGNTIETTHEMAGPKVVMTLLFGADDPGGQKQVPWIHGGYAYELVATGDDARPQITRQPAPFDPEKLKKSPIGLSTGIPARP
jgi:hypothetical protein